MRKVAYIGCVVVVISMLFVAALSSTNIEHKEDNVSQNVLDLSTFSDDSISEDDILANDDLEEYVQYDYCTWPAVEYPRHSMANICGLLLYEDNGWRKAFAEILLGYEAEGGYDPWDACWDLYDIDKSGIPELLYMPFTSGGGLREYYIYAFNNGTIENVGCFICHDIAICLDDGLICCDDWSQGEYYNSMIRLEDDQVVEVHHFYTNDGAVEDEEAEYMVDGENVTKENFYDSVIVPDSSTQEGRWDYPIARFSLGEYDDIFFMGIYPGISEPE